MVDVPTALLISFCRRRWWIEHEGLDSMLLRTLQGGDANKVDGKTTNEEESGADGWYERKYTPEHFKAGVSICWRDQRAE